MNVETFLLDTPPAGGKPLIMAAKRYTYHMHDERHQEPKDGLTLLMLHGLGQHKEQWEPIIEKLYALRRDSSISSRIREVWSFDWQSHGESAVLNEEALKDGSGSAPTERWASAITEFVKSDLVKGHRLIGISYSSGTIALMGTTRHFDPDKCPYAGLILVEPSMMDEEACNTNKEILSRFASITKAVTHRLNVWTDRETAHKYFIGHLPWKTWDSRVTRLFAEYGLKDAKDSEGNACVVRACPTIHEASAFQVNLKSAWTGVEQISKLSGLVPIHVVFGERVDLMPKAILDSVVDETKGRKVSSVTRIPGGHTIVQEQPDSVGSTLSHLLDTIQASQIRGRL
ncbi:Alpha/beta-hydrolase [Mycena venus]|uniref:Alpha/beta-hydrolase n=1 Tax=Mycena venus TaxID=2733690 RepID=A0A8H6WWZ8_9AGAR|nr:Alpha/beta-hydrolase [Mycena venus]